MHPNFDAIPSLSFRTRSEDQKSTRLAVFGDAGATDVSDLTFERIWRMVDDKDIDLVFHVGDIGYADGYQRLWDQFLRKVEVISAKVPYMVVNGTPRSLDAGV